MKSYVRLLLCTFAPAFERQLHLGISMQSLALEHALPSRCECRKATLRWSAPNTAWTISHAPHDLQMQRHTFPGSLCFYDDSLVGDAVLHERTPANGRDCEWDPDQRGGKRDIEE
jgi:hypothetical protein